MSIVTNATADLNMVGFSVTGINGFSSTFANVNTATINNLNILGSLALTFGSNSLPAYAFVGNTGTGMWSPGTNQLGFSTGGVQRLNIDSVGNVSATLFVGNLSSAEYINYPTATISTGVITSYINSGNRYSPWGARVGGTGIDYGQGVAINNFGDIIFSGLYATATTIYNAGGTFPAFSLVASNEDGFIVKYNASGTAQWAARISASANDSADTPSLNDAGDIAIIGKFSGAILTVYNAGGISVAFTLSNTGGGVWDIPIIKYNSAGTAQWGAKIVTANNDYGRSVKINNAGDIVTGAVYDGAPAIVYNAGGNVVAFTLANSLGQDVCVVKYSSAGTAQWGARISGTSNDWNGGLDMNNGGDIVVCGHYASLTLNVYNARGIICAFTLFNSGVWDAFLVKYNSSGSAQWATKVTTVNEDFGQGVGINDSGDIVFSGYYTGSPLNVYNTRGSVVFTLPNSGDKDAFVIKYNSAGTPLWGTRLSSPNADAAQDIAINSNGDIVVTGFYTSSPLTVYNAGGTITAFTLPNSGGEDGFMIRYNTNGTAIWGGRVSSPNNDGGVFTAINDIGDIVIAGYYTNAPLTVFNTGGTTTAYTLPNSGSNDAFLVKYSETISLTLPNPTINGQEKVIVSLGPQTFINPITINGTSTSLTIYSGDTLNLLWDATNSNWVNRDNISQISSGSAALPSYSFLSDTNTGMFSPAADNIAFSTGGIQRLQIDGIGNITSSNTNLNINSGNILLGTGSNDWTSSSSYYIGRNQSATFGTNSGFSGIEFGGPASANEGYLAFHTFDYPSTSGEMMRINKSGIVGANVFYNYNSCAVYGTATSINNTSLTNINLAIFTSFTPNSNFNITAPNTTRLNYTGQKGIFWIQGSVRVADVPGGGERGFIITKSGIDVSNNWSRPDGAGRWGTSAFSVVTINTNEYLEFGIYQYSGGGAISWVNGLSWLNVFVCRIG